MHDCTTPPASTDSGLGRRSSTSSVVSRLKHYPMIHLLKCAVVLQTPEITSRIACLVSPWVKLLDSYSVFDWDTRVEIAALDPSSSFIHDLDSDQRFRPVFQHRRYYSSQSQTSIA